MRLFRKFYVKNWNHTPDEKRHSFTITKGGEPSSIPTERIIYVLTEEMYWRNANAIHNWFINNVQNGTDDGGEYYVTQSNLRSLLSLVNKVLKNRSKASSILPTSSLLVNSCSTEYSTSYYIDLEDTQKILSVILLADKDEGEFTYQATN